MAPPPERISVKRRRQDEPVDTLYLQDSEALSQSHSQSHVPKRRFTDYYFKLLRDDSGAPRVPVGKPRQSLGLHASSSRQRQTALDADGIPVVRVTQPGDEVEDFRRLKAEQLARLKALASEDSESVPVPTPADGQPTEAKPVPTATALFNFAPDQPKSLQHARRFHLTRSLSTFHKPDLSGGIRKPTNHIRPSLPTFIERYKGLTILPSNDASPGQQNPSLEQAGKQQLDSDVLNPKVEASSNGSGTTINDHPSTWDTNSDRLADELAALAMELEHPQQHPSEPLVPNLSTANATLSPDQNMTDEADFILETYVRVLRDDSLGSDQASTTAINTVGVLVIDEEDEDLWQAYLDDDGESDWDEEDSNAEDNPANDYPEDEISDEDEFDRGAYNHRHNDSDDEQYGDDDDSESSIY